MKKYFSANFGIELILLDQEIHQVILRDRNGSVCECCSSLDDVSVFLNEVLDLAKTADQNDGK